MRGWRHYTLKARAERYGSLELRKLREDGIDLQKRVAYLEVQRKCEHELIPQYKSNFRTLQLEHESLSAQLECAVEHCFNDISRLDRKRQEKAVKQDQAAVELGSAKTVAGVKIKARRLGASVRGTMLEKKGDEIKKKLASIRVTASKLTFKNDVGIQTDESGLSRLWNEGQREAYAE